MIDPAVKESSVPPLSPVGFCTCRANLVLLDTARLVPLLAAWETEGLPWVPGTWRVAEAGRGATEGDTLIKYQSTPTDIY